MKTALRVNRMSRSLLAKMGFSPKTKPGNRDAIFKKHQRKKGGFNEK